MRKRIGVLLAGAALLALGGCNLNGAQPGYTSSDFNAAWQQLNAAYGAVQADAAQDPGVGSAFQGLAGLKGMIGPASLTPAAAGTLVKALANPTQLIPLAIIDLPRGGTDYTDPNGPTTYTPPSPYDLGVRWTTDSGDTAEMLVDWEHGLPTLYVVTQTGDQAERPQDAYGEVLLNTNRVAAGTLQADWTVCQSTGQTIDDPRSLSFSLTAQGANAQASMDFNFDHSSDNQVRFGYRVGFSAPRGEASFDLSLTADGTTTRDAQCFSTGFDADSVTLTAAIDASDTTAGVRHSAEFSITFSNAVLDANGNLQRADMEGYVKLDGTTALTFDGTLDDLDQTCPGANVNLHFADRTMTLRDWLIQNGHCTP